MSSSLKAMYDVVIIGAGPAGIGAAVGLQQKNIKDILLLDRESNVGGVPRHCQHPTFGLLTYKRPMKGNVFIAKILANCNNVTISSSTTVVSILPEGKLILSSKDGLIEVSAKRIIIATGVRETPRHPRLVSGVRPLGVLTVGALQQFTYLGKQKPCNCAVIVGSDLVSFSALWTLKNSKSKCVAIIEENKRITTYLLAYLFAMFMQTKIYVSTNIINIQGNDRVESVKILRKNNKIETIECDAVIFSGNFIGEYTLIRQSHLAHNLTSGAPIIDQNNQCSDPIYYTAGNMNHPADMGDRCYKEGLKVGKTVAQSLKQRLDQESDRIEIKHDSNIKFIYPSCINLKDLSQKIDLVLQLKDGVDGEVKILLDHQVIFNKRKRFLAHRNIKLSNIDFSQVKHKSQNLEIIIE